MKKILIAIFISSFLIAALSAAPLSVPRDKLFPVETEVVNRTATTYFVYAGIDTVEIINANQKLQKTRLKKNEYTYDKATACIRFKKDLPY